MYVCMYVCALLQDGDFGVAEKGFYALMVFRHCAMLVLLTLAAQR